MTATEPGSLLAGKNWSLLIKQLDTAVQAAEPGCPTQLLLNRAFCLQQLGLLRKALKDYDTVLAGEPDHPAALLSKAKVHVALKQGEDAQQCLAQLAAAATLGADVAVLLEGQLLAAALAAGEVREGAKLPLLPALAPPPPPPAPAPAPQTKPAKGFAPGFLAAPAKPAPMATPAASQAGSGLPVQLAAAPSPVAASSDDSGASSSSSVAAVASRSAAAAQPPSAVGVDPLHRLMARTNPDQCVALAVQLVNDGSCQEAVNLLDLLLYHHPANIGALAARGTALALMLQLPEAVLDFDAAIAAEPLIADFRIRRAQSLSALGEDDRAVADLRHAIALTRDAETKAQIHHDLGRLYHKAKDYQRAVQELQTAASLASAGPSAELLCVLGLCQVSRGDLQDAIATFDRGLLLEPDHSDLWLNLGMACKEICWVERADKALRKAASLGRGTTVVHAFRLLAQMRQGLGDHLGAIQDLNRGIAASDAEAQRVELRFLRGACHHALGLHRRAVDDYAQTMEAQVGVDPTTHPEVVPFLCLSFYQKEMALYVRKNLDRNVLSFCPDADFHPEFKELWCKKGPPSAEFVNMYRFIAQPQHPNWDAPPPPPPPAAQLAALLAAADAVGKLVQYNHQGFLPNKRQLRMAGLAAIELAQTLQQLASDRRAGRPTMVDNAGASVSARRGEPGSGRHECCWRDAMDGVVRWRQLAEPNDQVIWVDLLTERQFREGFGSHTPMFTGQTKCVRYYMAFHRALAVLKRVLAAEGRATDANDKPIVLDSEERRAAAAAAQTAGDMWQALGADGWAVVPIESCSRPGHKLEGTRLTIVKMVEQAAAVARGAAAAAAEDGGQPAERATQGAQDAGAGGAAAAPDGRRKRPARRQEAQPDAYEFSIRTPVTPARWEDYDQELAAQFEGLVAALAEGEQATAAGAALRFAYYWYNFMPLARGSALCGYVSLLAAFMAAGVPVRAALPKDYQTDWEAILESRPEAFAASVSDWMLPPELGGGGGEAAAPPVDQLPKVIELLPTMRARLEALNDRGVGRI